MKEFIVSYTLDDDIVSEKVIKELNIKKEDIKKEVIEKVNRYKHFIVKNEHGYYTINSNLVRYVRVK